MAQDSGTGLEVFQAWQLCVCAPLLPLSAPGLVQEIRAGVSIPAFLGRRECLSQWAGLGWAAFLGSVWTTGQAELSPASGPALASRRVTGGTCSCVGCCLSPARSLQARPAPPTACYLLFLLLFNQTSAGWGIPCTRVSDFDPSWGPQRVREYKTTQLQV
jgi:hypothetical protein